MSRRAYWGRSRVTADDIERALGGPARLRAVTVPCLHFQDSLHFYTGCLGLRLTRQARGHAVLDAGSVRVVLVDASKMSDFQPQPGQGLYVEIEVGDLDAVQVRLARFGGPSYAPRRSAAGVLMTVQDPEGNLVNLVEPVRRAAR